MTALVTGVLRVVLGALLLIAGGLKLQAPITFATEISNYQLFPSLAPYLAATLPMTELVLGLGLIVARRPWRRAAALGALALFVAFAIAVGVAYFRGINIDCGCFGAGGGPITIVTLLRNLALMGAAASLQWLERRPARDREAPKASSARPTGES